jgi:hypothetical protein
VSGQLCTGDTDNRPANEMTSHSPSNLPSPEVPAVLSQDPTLWTLNPLDGISPDFTFPSSDFPNLFDFSQDETNRLLASLQQGIPDMGRMFDASIGDLTQQDMTSY